MEATYLETINITEDKGVIKNIICYGEGETPSEGQEVIAHYTGTLLDGTKFDSSVDRDSPFKFQIGVGQVIKAWDLGFATMKKGEKAQIVAKSDYAYGQHGSPPTIPADATLQFEVELLDFYDKPKEINEMTNDERYKIASTLKENANQLITQVGNYSEANELYLKALQHIKPNISNNEIEDENNKLLLSIYLNLSLTSNKIKDYRNSISYAKNALDMDGKNIKGLFRKSLSENESNEFEDSLKTINQLLEIDKDNLSAKKLMVNVKNKIKKDKERQKNLYSNLF